MQQPQGPLQLGLLDSHVVPHLGAHVLPAGAEAQQPGLLRFLLEGTGTGPAAAASQVQAQPLCGTSSRYPTHVTSSGMSQGLWELPLPAVPHAPSIGLLPCSYTSCHHLMPG